jgi:hypothetical protein
MASAAVSNVVATANQVSLFFEMPRDMTFEQWLEHGKTLASAHQSLNWWIGDWWAAGSHRYGARANVAAEGIFGREFQSLMNTASICRAFTTSRRREALSFSHHAEVASLSPAKADALLDQAEAEGWSVKDLRNHVSTKRKETREASPLNQFPVQERLPSIAQQIEEEAARIGEKLPDFLARLIALGWTQYQAEGGNDAGV